MKTVVSVLSAEEQALNLTQPQGVGQRPRPCNVEHVKDDEFFSVGQNVLLPNVDRKGMKKGIGNNSANSSSQPHCGKKSDFSFKNNLPKNPSLRYCRLTNYKTKLQIRIFRNHH